MSGNRKRSGAGGILDQLEPRPARGKAPPGFSIGIEPRWVWAGGGAIALLVAALASIAWSTTTAARPLPQAEQTAQAAPPGPKPVFEEGPARVERVPIKSHQAAALLLAKVEPPPMPPPMPLVVLPRETPPKAPARVVHEPSTARPAAAAATLRSSGKPAPRHASARKPVPKPQRARPAPAPEAAPDADPDVALIRAIRKATQTQSN